MSGPQKQQWKWRRVRHCRRDTLHRRRYRLGVRTAGSQPANRGSNPRTAIRFADAVSPAFAAPTQSAGQGRPEYDISRYKEIRLHETGRKNVGQGILKIEGRLDLRLSTIVTRYPPNGGQSRHVTITEVQNSRSASI